MKTKLYKIIDVGKKKVMERCILINADLNVNLTEADKQKKR